MISSSPLMIFASAADAGARLHSRICAGLLVRGKVASPVGSLKPLIRYFKREVSIWIG